MKTIQRLIAGLLAAILVAGFIPTVNVQAAEVADTTEAVAEVSSDSAETAVSEETTDTAETADDAKTTDTAAAADTTETKKSSYTGPVLNRRAGTVNGPSGKEVYYNMNMSGVVSVLHRKGYTGEYWVRSDGVKMFGDYVMVAANYKIHPYGSIIQTSLGDAIVCDTGSFIYTYPTALDVAVAW